MNKLISINPATEEIIHEFEPIDNSMLDNIICSAQKAFLSWRFTSFKTRSGLLLKLSSILKNSREKLSEIITLEMGKPITQAAGEVDKCAWLCEYYAENAEEFLKSEHIKTDAAESYIQYDPLGVLLGIMPWNFPFWQAFRFAVPAMAGGNTVLIKHAPNVTITAMQIENIFREAGFPEGTFQILLVDVNTVPQIISHESVKGVSVTASERTGSIVASHAGREIKKTVLELGGSDPFIILEDADMDSACEAGVLSRLINSGQTCISAKRFIVAGSRYSEFIDKFISVIRKKRVGNPMEKDTDIGPLARLDILENLYRQVDESVNKGARIIFHGESRQDKGYYFAPVILDNINNTMPVYSEETFGPACAVLKVKDAEEAVNIANSTRFGLGASIWTENINLAKNMASGINAGHIAINGTVKSDPRLPFGGTGRSGYGRELSFYGCREFMNIKTIWIK